MSLKTSLLSYWDDVSQRNVWYIRKERVRLITMLDGDIFFPFHKWPVYMRRLFFNNERPMGDTNTFKLVLFLVGNGLNPEIAGKWILTTYVVSDWHKIHSMAQKRTDQIVWISDIRLYALHCLNMFCFCGRCH